MARVALVTGGTRGIGEAISVALNNAGYKVAACDISEENANAFKERTGLPCYLWDVSNYESCKAGIAQLEADLGPVEVLVNNAGITRDAFLQKMTPDQWNAVISTNLTSVFNMSRLVIEGMRARGFGRIVSISSVNGQKGQAGQCNYSAAKAGVIGFTKALAQEGANKGITVNAVCPGYTDTEMVRKIAPDVLSKIVATVPVGRLCSVEEIARAVAFLAADEAGTITGATISVNGGLYYA